MKTDRTRNVSRNFTWGMFQRIVSSLFPFITRTVMIYTIGLSYVGLSGLFSSVLMVLNLAELGIGSAIVYFMYKPMLCCGEDDWFAGYLDFYHPIYFICL